MRIDVIRTELEACIRMCGRGELLGEAKMFQNVHPYTYNVARRACSGICEVWRGVASILGFSCLAAENQWYLSWEQTQ